MKLTGQSKFNQFYGDGKPSEFQNFRGFKNRKKKKINGQIIVMPQLSLKPFIHQFSKKCQVYKSTKLSFVMNHHKKEEHKILLINKAYQHKPCAKALF